MNYQSCFAEFCLGAHFIQFFFFHDKYDLKKLWFGRLSNGLYRKAYQLQAKNLSFYFHTFIFYQYINHFHGRALDEFHSISHPLQLHRSVLLYLKLERLLNIGDMYSKDVNSIRVGHCHDSLQLIFILLKKKIIKKKTIIYQLVKKIYSRTQSE